MHIFAAIARSTVEISRGWGHHAPPPPPVWPASNIIISPVFLGLSLLITKSNEIGQSFSPEWSERPACSTLTLREMVRALMWTFSARTYMEWTSKKKKISFSVWQIQIFYNSRGNAHFMKFWPWCCDMQYILKILLNNHKMFTIEPTTYLEKLTTHKNKPIITEEKVLVKVFVSEKSSKQTTK